MKKTLLILLGALALAFLAYGIFKMLNQKVYRWKFTDQTTQNGPEPYEHRFFDEFMRRSLSHGYCVDTIGKNNIAYSENGFELTNLPLDTTIMVLSSYPLWVHDNNSCQYINFIQELANFASRGGQAIFVFTEDFGHASYWVEDITSNTVRFYEEQDFDNKKYSPRWLAQRNDQQQWVMTPSGEQLVVNTRYVVSFFMVNKPSLETLNECNVLSWNDKPVDFKSVITSKNHYTPDKQRYTVDHSETRKNRERVLIEPNYQIDPVSDIYANEASDFYYSYALDMYFPETGGRLYVSTLGLYFTNLGLTLPEGPEVIESLMQELDNRPVMRLAIPQAYSLGNSNSDLDIEVEETEPLDLLQWVKSNRAVALSLALLVVLGLAVLARGLMRRHPVSRYAEEDDPDLTDEYVRRSLDVRKSPLLHFLFQISWLYKPSGNHADLFAINFKRMARMTARLGGVELASASPSELKHAAETIAANLDMNAQDVLLDLIWFRKLSSDNQPMISSRQFSESQYRVEKYPMY